MILCVNNNPDTLESLCVILDQAGFGVITAQTGSKAIIKAHSGIFDLFILDVHLSDGPGIELCKEIRKADKRTPVLFYSSDGQPRHIEEAMKAGAQAYLTEAALPMVLLEFVARLIKEAKSG
jgi:two-component system, OmpR family, alkaline phosphatase synthesis response regulator PhoP